MSQSIYQMLLTDDPDGGVDVEFPDLPGCYSFGDDEREAVAMGIDAAKTWVATQMAAGGRIPDSTGHEVPDGSRPVVAFETDEGYVVQGPVVSAAEASRRLGVSPGRVSHMLRSGVLDGHRDGRRTLVSVGSIDRRLARHPKAGRPRKAKETAV